MKTHQPILDYRIPELDGLRGLAIGMVLIWHLYFGTMDPDPGTALYYLHAAGRLTWSGVDLFFVLSGFLIGGILIDNRSATNYYRTFYTRRLFRIVPAYFVSIFAFWVLVKFAQGAGAHSFGFIFALKVLPWTPHFLFLQNFWMAAQNVSGIMVITWSLCIEEQFYLTLPVLVRFLPPKRLLVMASATILLAPALRSALLVFWPGHRWAAFVLLPTRADSLMLGVLGALLLRNARSAALLRQRRTEMRLALLLAGAGALVLLRYSWFPTAYGIQSIGYTWLAILYLCILLYSLVHGGWLSRVLRWQPLMHLGTLAYGVYLYHVLVIWLIFGSLYSSTAKITNLREFAWSIVTLIVVWFIAWSSWKYFEKPLVKMGQRTKYEFTSRPLTSNADGISAEASPS